MDAVITLLNESGRLLVNTFAAAESNFNRRIRRILSARHTRMTLSLSLAIGAAVVFIGILGLPTVSSFSKDDSDPGDLRPTSLLVTPFPGHLDGAVRQAWHTEGVTSETQVLERLQEETISVLKKRFQEAGMPEGTFEKLPDGTIRIDVKPEREDQADRMAFLGTRAGNLCIHHVANDSTLHTTLESLEKDEEFGKPFLSYLALPPDSNGPIVTPCERFKNVDVFIPYIRRKSGLLPPGMALRTYVVPGEGLPMGLILMEREPCLCGLRPQSARVIPYDKVPQYDFELTWSPQDAARLDELKRTSQGPLHVAFVLDSLVLSTASFSDVMPGSNPIRIGSAFPQPDAREWAAILASGPLPAPVKIELKSRGGQEETDAQADALMKDGKYEEARECYERACAANPKDAAAQAGLGDALLQLDRNTDAMAAFQRALESDPSCGRAKVGLAHVLCKSGKFSEGLDLLDAVLNAEAEHPHTPLVREVLGALATFQGRIYKAQRAGEVTRARAQEWQKRSYALIERAQIALGYTVLRLEKPLNTARETEVETNVGGLAMVLEYLNIAADYDTLMGDSGMAFAWQATAIHKKGGKVLKYLRAESPFAFVTRVDFLSQTLGRGLQHEYLPDHAGEAANLRAFDYEHVLPAVEAEVKAGRPVLGLDTRAMVVTGYKLDFNGDLDCFLVHWPGPDANRPSGFREYVLGVVSVGEPVPQLDRNEADRLALQHAVLLGRDALFHGASFPQAVDTGGDSDCASYSEDVTTSRTYYTGCESFALWKDSVKDESSQAYEDRGYAYRDLATLRRSASAYLRAMASRHPEDVATALNQAAGFYDRVLEALPTQADYDPEHLFEETRQQVAGRISRIAELEGNAIDSLEKAQGAIR